MTSSKIGLAYGAVQEAARFAGVHRTFASRVANGKQPWRTARLSLIRALYAVGWHPPAPDDRRTVRRWLDAMSETLDVETPLRNRAPDATLRKK